MSESQIASLSNAELLAATRHLAGRSCEVEAELLLHLGEIDERRLYLDRAWPSMHAFCVRELGFSEGAAYNRIFVARAARKLPAMLDALRTGRVHLAGLRLLAPHLTQENHGELLAKATGRTREEIAVLVAGIAPWASPCTAVWKLPVSAILPTSDKTWRVQIDISDEVHQKFRHFQDLMQHRVPDGDLAKLFEAAIDIATKQVEKERFAIGREARSSPEPVVETDSRHIPDAIKRLVYERDGGRCTFVDETGKRCEETGGLEFEHNEGFALTHSHDPDRIRLLCRAHNRHAAEKLYGRAFMEAAQARACPGTSSAGPPSA